MSSTSTKRLYGVKTFRRFMSDAVASFPALRQIRRAGGIGTDFSERIMLAVTQVNGCALCSYAHTQAALSGGMDANEVEMILAGEFSDAPENERIALTWAEHYADTAGRPDPAATARLTEAYGPARAAQVIAATRAIMAGNLHGNMVDALRHRLRGAAFEGSTLGRELGIVLGIVWILPVAALGRLFGGRRAVAPLVA